MAGGRVAARTGSVFNSVAHFTWGLSETVYVQSCTFMKHFTHIVA